RLSPRFLCGTCEIVVAPCDAAAGRLRLAHTLLLWRDIFSGRHAMFGFGRSSTDALARLREDHRRVEQLFAQFGRESQPARQAALASEICNELTVHAQVEEELFYPAVMAASPRPDDTHVLWEATVEHG